MWSELRERAAQYDSRTSDRRLCGPVERVSGLAKKFSKSAVCSPVAPVSISSGDKAGEN